MSAMVPPSFRGPRNMLRWFCNSMLALALLWPAALLAKDFDPGWAPFPTTVSSTAANKTIPYREFALFHAPRDEVILRVADAQSGEYQLRVDGDLQIEAAPGAWLWRTPATPGWHRLDIVHRDGAALLLHLFVAMPMTAIEDGQINGYRIGHYPAASRHHPDIHQPPSGLIEVTQQMVDLPVSPHFTLGQFLCRQQPDHWPKYLVLQPALVEKLELLLAEVNERGIRTDGLYIMSGYRTPWYNRSIGNEPFSLHIRGAAADIFVDTVGDDRMDDLTGNGTSDVTEARILQRIVEETFADPPSPTLVGGLGLYGPRPHRGPFIHVDVRGEEARWEFP